MDRESEPSPILPKHQGLAMCGRLVKRRLCIGAPAVVTIAASAWGLASHSTAAGNCHESYPTVCIPPPPPDLDCGEISYRRFEVKQPDPHGFDGDKDGIGCEKD